MAEFTPSPKTAQDFNNGQKYINGDIENGIMGDALQADMPNNVIEGFLYLQGLAVNQPDVSEANQVGTASASIVIASDGTARLKLSNLKGEQGVGISTIVENGVDANGGNIYKITLEDGQTYNFVAPKGKKGNSAITYDGVATKGMTIVSLPITLDLDFSKFNFYKSLAYGDDISDYMGETFLALENETISTGGRESLEHSYITLFQILTIDWIAGLVTSYVVNRTDITAPSLMGYATETYVDTAIANAITTALNTPV